MDKQLVDALKKAHRYFQPHIAGKSKLYREEAKVAVENALKLCVPNFDDWDKKRVRKETVGLLTNAYKTGLVKEQENLDN